VVRAVGGFGGRVTVLRVIKAAQRLGFTLDEVADLLEVRRHRHRRTRDSRSCDAGSQARARPGSATATTWVTVAVTYLVPFGVSNVGLLVGHRRRAEAGATDPPLGQFAAVCPGHG
jgi:hypothetical protein